MASKIDARLTRGLSPEDAEEFVQRWESSQTVRESIADLLTKELSRVILESESDEFLTGHEVQARVLASVEKRKTLRSLIKLLDPNRQET